MESDDFEAALAALPEGYSEGIYEGRRYGVNDMQPRRTEWRNQRELKSFTPRRSHRSLDDISSSG